MKRKVGRPKKFKDKALLHVWVERSVVEEVDKRKEWWHKQGQVVSRGDVITGALDDSTGAWSVRK